MTHAAAQQSRSRVARSRARLPRETLTASSACYVCCHGNSAVFFRSIRIYMSAVTSEVTRTHTPDWDLPSRITTARAALERGIPPKIVRKAYGEQVLAAATAKPNER
jgi:hypothetical protein